MQFIQVQSRTQPHTFRHLIRMPPCISSYLLAGCTYLSRQVWILPLYFLHHCKIPARGGLKWKSASDPTWTILWMLREHGLCCLSRHKSVTTEQCTQDAGTTDSWPEMVKLGLQRHEKSLYWSFWVRGCQCELGRMTEESPSVCSCVFTLSISPWARWKVLAEMLMPFPACT